MKKQILLVLSALLLVLSAVGCKKGDGIQTDRTTEFQKYELEGLLENAETGAFTVSDNGELFLSENSEKICRYSADGTLLATYGEAKNARALCLMGQELFVYTYDNQLLRVSVKDGKTETLVEQFSSIHDIQNLVSAGEYLYAHVLESGMESCLKRISPKTGAIEDVETAEGTLRAVYGASDGHLYYITERQGGTFLYEYQKDKKTSTLKYDLTDRLEIYSTVLTFVCEQGMFLYTTMEKALFVFSLEEELYASVPTDGMVSLGTDIACGAGNVVYRSFSAETGKGSLHTVYLGDVELKPIDTEHLEGTVVVCTYDNSGQLDVKKIQEASGLKTKLKTRENNDEFLTELMAGDSDVDIYMISIGDHTFRREGLYEPLNSSKVIQAYQDACFPSVSEGMETETGDIWMLPIAVNMDSLWYVEDNLEKFGVSPERFRTMESFLELSKEMKERLAQTEYYTYANSNSLGDLWSDQYTRVYCDVPHGVVNYKTDVYRNFFDTMWTGWNIYSKQPEHPYIERYRSTEGFYGMIYDEPQYHTENMLYKYCSVGEHLSYGHLEGWRVLPAPKFSEEVQGDEIRGLALVLNPNSRQKELAMAYLEAIAKNPVGIYESDWYTSFLFSDKSVYRETCDVELPAFQDLYELFAGGMINPYPNSYPYYDYVVDDYQNGRLTLDEALDKLQREMDMYLNE